MLSFSTEFPLALNSPDAVLTSVMTWLQGSPHRELTDGDIDALFRGEKSKIETDNQSVELIKVERDSSYSIAVRHIVSDHPIIYTTTIVSNPKDGLSWINISTDRASLDPLISLPQAKKPQIIRIFLRDIGGGLDGELWVQDSPHFLKDSDENMAVRLINGDSENHLPVVYLSRTFDNEMSCNAKLLASHLGGLAHVVVEPSRGFSRRIQHHTNSRNVYGGVIGVYLPTGQRSVIFPDKINERTLRFEATEIVRTSLLTRMPISGFSWPDVEATRSRLNIELLRSEGSTDLDAFVREFDAENQALIEQIDALKKEVAALKIASQQAHSPQNANNNSGNSVFIQDYFPGESQNFIRDAIETALKHVADGSRRKMVLEEFYARTKSSPEIEERRKKLKASLEKAEGLDSRTEKALRELGFTISSDGKHHKLTYFGDQRLTFTMAKTASDWRAGKNLASNIAKKIY